MKPKAPLTSWRRSPPRAPDEKATADLLRIAGEPDALSSDAHARISRRLREPPRRRRLALPDMRMALAAGGLALALVVGGASVVLLEHGSPLGDTHAAPRPRRIAEAPRSAVAAAAPQAPEPEPKPVPALQGEEQAASLGAARQLLAKAPARSPAKAAKGGDFGAMDRLASGVDDEPALAHRGGAGRADKADLNDALALRERAKTDTFEPSELPADSARATGSAQPLRAAAPQAAPPPAAPAATAPMAASGAVAARRESIEEEKNDRAADRDGAALPPLSPGVCAQLLEKSRSGESADLRTGTTLDEQELFDLARCRLQAGQRDAARADLRQYLSTFPRGPHAAAVRALLAK